MLRLSLRVPVLLCLAAPRLIRPRSTGTVNLAILFRPQSIFRSAYTTVRLYTVREYDTLHFVLSAYNFDLQATLFRLLCPEHNTQTLL